MVVYSISYNTCIYLQSSDQPNAEEMFHLMTPNDSRTYVSRDEINIISGSRLQRMCDVLNKVKPRLRDELWLQTNNILDFTFYFFRTYYNNCLCHFI